MPTTIKDLDASEMEEYLRGRAEMYSFLAGLYQKELDSAQIEELHRSLYPYESGDDDMNLGYWLIATYLSNISADSEDELRCDYARCFVGNGNDGYAAAYPFESVYTSKKRLLMQDARDEVLAIYRAEGLDKKPEWREAEDHVSLELEFVSYLSNTAANALANSDAETARKKLSVQANFMHDHLCRWLPYLLRDFEKRATTEFYQGLAFLTRGFVKRDLEEADELAGLGKAA